MSLQLMKERVRHSGSTAREEMIIDGQNLLKEELEYDSSYSPTMYFWNPVLGCDDRPAKVRIYKQKYSSLNGNYQNFLTTYDNPIKIGEYLHDAKDDTYWLIYNSFNVNDVYYKGKMIQCNYLLRWQLANGKIIERFSNIVSASKYDVGETGNNTLMLSSNNYTIVIGYCEEGFELEGKRVFIDMKLTNPTKVFKITRSDDVLYNSGNMGSLLSFIADKVEFNPNADNQELRICDYIDSYASLPSTLQPLDEKKDSNSPNMENKNSDYSIRILCEGENYLFAGGEDKTFTAVLIDSHGNQIKNHSIEWSVTIVPGKEKYISYEIAGNNSIMIRSTYDSSIIGQKILLTASALGIQKSIYIDIGGGI